jgi:hypothetical protein
MVMRGYFPVFPSDRHPLHLRLLYNTASTHAVCSSLLSSLNDRFSSLGAPRGGKSGSIFSSHLNVPFYSIPYLSATSSNGGRLTCQGAE